MSRPIDIIKFSIFLNEYCVHTRYVMPSDDENIFYITDYGLSKIETLNIYTYEIHNITDNDLRKNIIKAVSKILYSHDGRSYKFFLFNEDQEYIKIADYIKREIRERNMKNILDTE